MFRDYATKNQGILQDDLSADATVPGVNDGVQLNNIKDEGDQKEYFHKLEMGKNMEQLWDEMYG